MWTTSVSRKTARHPPGFLPTLNSDVCCSWLLPLSGNRLPRRARRSELGQNNSPRQHDRLVKDEAVKYRPRRMGAHTVQSVARPITGAHRVRLGGGAQYGGCPVSRPPPPSLSSLRRPVGQGRHGDRGSHRPYRRHATLEQRRRVDARPPAHAAPPARRLACARLPGGRHGLLRQSVPAWGGPPALFNSLKTLHLKTGSIPGTVPGPGTYACY